MIVVRRGVRNHRGAGVALVRESDVDLARMVVVCGALRRYVEWQGVGLDRLTEQELVRLTGAIRGVPAAAAMPQALVLGASGSWWRVDFRMGRSVVGECDGAGKSTDGTSLWKEKRRQLDGENAGKAVVR